MWRDSSSPLSLRNRFIPELSSSISGRSCSLCLCDTDSWNFLSHSTTHGSCFDTLLYDTKSFALMHVSDTCFGKCWTVSLGFGVLGATAFLFFLPLLAALTGGVSTTFFGLPLFLGIGIIWVTSGRGFFRGLPLFRLGIFKFWSFFCILLKLSIWD